MSSLAATAGWPAPTRSLRPHDFAAVRARIPTSILAGRFFGFSSTEHSGWPDHQRRCYGGWCRSSGSSPFASRGGHPWRTREKAANKVLALRGEWDEAVPQLEGGLAFAREHGNLITLPRFHTYLAIIAASRGDLTTAEQALASSVGELSSDHPCYEAEFVFYAASLLAEFAG